MNLTSAAIEAAAEAFLKDDTSYCECRHTTLDKHDVNPPCSTRKRVTAQMANALEAAAPHMCPDIHTQRTEWPDIPRARGARQA